jgi:hypothetical protein
MSLHRLATASSSLARKLSLDPLSILLPFLAKLNAQVLFFHHTEVQILGFGALMSAVYVGRFASTLLLSGARATPVHQYTSAHAGLAAVFLLVGISSRFVVLLLACLIVGLLQDWRADGRSSNSLVKENTNSAEADARRRLLSSAFAIIISGFLYREHARFPALYPGLVASCLFSYTAYESSQGRTVRQSKFSAQSHQRGHTGDALPPKEGEVSRSILVPALSQPLVQASDVPASDVPEAFTKMWGGTAHGRYVDMLQWRQLNRMDLVLDSYNPHFTDILKYYPHAIHGRSRDECMVLYEVARSAPPLTFVSSFC